MAQRYIPISDLGEIVTGKTPPTANGELWGGSIPFITPTDIKGFSSFYQGETERTVSDVGASKQKKTLLPKNSVCVSCIATIGKMCLTSTESITNQQINTIVPNKNYDHRYVLYLLRYNLPYIQLVGGGSGSGTPIISKSKFAKFTFLIEDSLPTQQKIASILSAYDSQIENNQKRIKLLEQMAENLYKEWFVRFRFPGYENAEFEGGLPIGWKDLQAQDVFNITIGRTPSRKVFEFFSTERENNCSWISISDMKNGMFIKDTSEYLTPEALKACNMPMVKANTVLLSFKLTVGKVAISLEETSTNEAIAHFNTDDNTLKEYTYLYLKCFNYSKLGNTSAIGNAINSTIVKNMSFILPSKDIILEFHKQAKPLFDEILNLTQQISSLTHQRDLLLPRLMSGKLSI